MAFIRKWHFEMSCFSSFLRIINRICGSGHMQKIFHMCGRVVTTIMLPIVFFNFVKLLRLNVWLNLLSLKRLQITLVLDMDTELTWTWFWIRSLYESKLFQIDPYRKCQNIAAKVAKLFFVKFRWNLRYYWFLKADLWKRGPA